MLGCNCGLGAWGRGGGSAHGCPMVGHGGVPCIGVPHAWSPPHLGGGVPTGRGVPPQNLPVEGGCPHPGDPTCARGGFPTHSGSPSWGGPAPWGFPNPHTRSPCTQGGAHIRGSHIRGVPPCVEMPIPECAHPALPPSPPCPLPPHPAARRCCAVPGQRCCSTTTPTSSGWQRVGVPRPSAASSSTTIPVPTLSAWLGASCSPTSR